MDVEVCMDKKTQLWELCKEFIEVNGIGCEEVIHQCDWVIERAYSLLEEMCNIVGYAEDEN